MEERFNRIETKIDKIVELQSDIRIDLSEHIRRTEIAESNINKLAVQIAPIQEHVAFIRVSGRILTVLLSIASVIAAFLAAK